MKLVAAICGYDSAKFLDRVIKKLLQIPDIDVIHYMDGSWRKGFGPWSHSTDGTLKIIESWSRNLPDMIDYDVMYPPSYFMWKNESDKRNTQLRTIQQRHGKDSWVLVIDDDELLSTGPIKKYLKDKEDKVGLINAIAPPPGPKLAECTVMKSPRLIKLGNGIHYHSETNMLIHDRNHKTIADYKPGQEHYSFDKTFTLPEAQIENLWMHRDNVRMSQKKDYFLKMEKTSRRSESCKEDTDEY